MRKNGFTLVELLGVIALLTIIFLIVVPSIINLVKKTTIDIDKATEELIYSSTRIYIDKNSYDYPLLANNVYCITIDDLIKSGELEEGLVDIKTGKKVNPSLIIKVEIENAANVNYNLVKNNQCEEVRNENNG